MTQDEALLFSNWIITEWSGQVTEWHKYAIKSLFSNLIVTFQLTEWQFHLMMSQLKRKLIRLCYVFKLLHQTLPYFDKKKQYIPICKSTSNGKVCINTNPVNLKCTGTLLMPFYLHVFNIVYSTLQRNGHLLQIWLLCRYVEMQVIKK